MDFVWVYSRGQSMFYKLGWCELEWSIKTVKKFYKDARIWVVGDKPPFEMELNWIEDFTTPTVRGGLHVENVDIVKKLRLVLDSEVEEEFVMMYDDQFFLRKITKKDLRPTALCRVESVESYDRVFGLMYGNLWRSTYKTIFEMTEDVYDWETHLPRLMTKERTRFILDTFEPGENNLMVHSLYYTYFDSEPILLSEDDSIRSHTWTIGNNMDYDNIFSKKFLILHDDSLIPLIMNRIEGLV